MPRKWVERHREKMRGNSFHNYAWLGRKHTEEEKKKISDANKGKKVSEKTKIKLSLAHRGKRLSEEHKKKIGIKSKENWNNREYREKMLNLIKELNLGFRRGNIPWIKNKHHSEETKKKISTANSGEKNGMKRPEIYKKVLEKSKRTPNDSEKRVIEILNMNNLPFKFVGDFSFWIGPCKSGKCRNPDFIHNNNGIKKAILVDGTHWHNEDSIREENEDYSDKSWKVLRFPHNLERNLIIEKVKNFEVG
jgi:hypothetical protein